MSKGYGQADPALARYVERVFDLADPVLSDVQGRADAAALPEIAISPGEGRLIEILTRAVGARRAVEIGTLAGFSAINILRGLPDDGTLYTFEYDQDHARIARENIERHGFGNRVRLFVGKARDHLPEITSEGPFDLVFIDADKESYPQYLAWAEENLRRGGMVLLDNAFAWGRVTAPEGDAAATAIHQTNERLARSGRFCSMMIPTAEGLAIGIKVR